MQIQKDIIGQVHIEVVISDHPRILNAHFSVFYFVRMKPMGEISKAKQLLSPPALLYHHHHPH